MKIFCTHKLIKVPRAPEYRVHTLPMDNILMKWLCVLFDKTRNDFYLTVSQWRIWGFHTLLLLLGDLESRHGSSECCYVLIIVRVYSASEILKVPLQIAETFFCSQLSIVWKPPSRSTTVINLYYKPLSGTSTICYDTVRLSCNPKLKLL